MKNRLVQTLENGGNLFGQVSHPDDLMKAQQFGHERISDLVADFMNDVRNYEARGFAYEMDADNAFDITIKKPGRVYTKDGVSFELMGDTTLSFAAADAEFPRLDLVVAVLDDEVDAELDLIPFVRLRTAEEFSEAVPPYAPQNINVPKEKHWRAVPQIRTGTPAATASKPVVASNEVPLYLVAVAPGATAIREADILDLREVIQTLRKINGLLGKNVVDISVLQRRVAALEKLSDIPIDLSQVFGSIKTLGSILGDLQSQVIASRDVPEIRYDRPKFDLVDINSSKILAVGGITGDVPYVDIPIGGRINFGDSEVVILPKGFADPARNARFATVNGVPEHVRRVEELTLDNVTQIAGDGFVDFVERAAEFDAARGRPAAAARNGQFIEIFGGLASDNSSKLSEWLTYDVTNDEIVSREPGTALPNSDRPAMMPYGDGTNVLVIAGDTATTSPGCFKLNADTGVVTAIGGTKPTGIQFFGDLIAAGKIFVVAIRKIVGGYATDFWEFDTGTNTFTQLGVTGSVPSPHLDCASGCFYATNQFLLVMFDPSVSSSGKTYRFDRTSLQWTQMNIPQPFGGSPDKQLPVTRFNMANVNGRPLLVGGAITKDTDAANAKVWELTKGGWQSWDATFPPVQEPGFCSTLGGSSLPNGKAFLFAGHGKYSDAHKRIYSSTQGGLIAVDLLGVEGISIASSASFVQFEIDPFTAEWAVAGYWTSLSGRFDRSNVKMEVSFNNGVNWHEIDPNGRTFNVTDSSDPAERRVRITLYSNKSKPPILTLLSEALDSDGGELEDRLVVRYDFADVEVMALYIDRQGVVTLSEDILPSTSERCLVHRVTPVPASAPEVKNYINRRRAHFKYTGVAADGIAPASIQFENELAVPVRYVDARGVAADPVGMIYHMPDPEVTFDEVITLTDVRTDGDGWIVELEG